MTKKEKASISGDTVYGLITSPEAYRVYVTVAKNGEMEPVYNEVSIGNALDHYQTACIFEKVSDAEAFKQELAKTNNKANNLKVVTRKPDRHGYFKARTKYGDCLLSAAAFNEFDFFGASQLSSKEESYRRTVSRGSSLVDNPLFVDFD